MVVNLTVKLKYMSMHPIFPSPTRGLSQPLLRALVGSTGPWMLFLHQDGCQDSRRLPQRPLADLQPPLWTPHRARVIRALGSPTHVWGFYQHLPILVLGADGLILSLKYSWCQIQFISSNSKTKNQRHSPKPRKSSCLARKTVLV